MSPQYSKIRPSHTVVWHKKTKRWIEQEIESCKDDKIAGKIDLNKSPLLHSNRNLTLLTEMTNSFIEAHYYSTSARVEENFVGHAAVQSMVKAAGVESAAGV